MDIFELLYYGITSVSIAKSWYCKSQKEVEKWQPNRFLLKDDYLISKYFINNIITLNSKPAMQAAAKNLFSQA